MKKILGRSVMTADEMNTVLIEVEAMVNSRPLTFIGDDPDEYTYITPASFLIRRPITSIPVKPIRGVDPKATKTRKELNQQLKLQDKYLNSIWKMWSEEYVRNLGTVPTKVEEDECLKPGELVMVAERTMPRTKWRVGVVDKVKEGRDGKIRTAWINTAKHQERGRQNKNKWIRSPSAPKPLPRPIQHVSRLELDSMEDFKQFRL